ncbi:MAG: MFS transporter [Leptospirales bacterium]|nr:MFS transporter [Leptospirales bacterium]
MKMITKFSLYGFLKNLDFSEPFLILFYLSLGLNFLQIGILVSFLNICINILEIPSGAIADIYGRKNSMLVSLGSYIISFIIFAFSDSYPPLFIALFFYAIGESFRSGTHKAMIFDWLRLNDRLSEKTKVYGFTRSWSKYGSAVSVIISTIIVIFTDGYRWIFVFSIIPDIFGLWNIATYPKYLNKRLIDKVDFTFIFKHTYNSIKSSFMNLNLRKLIIQSTGFEGVFEVTKDYLQPILKAQALALAVYLTLSEKDSTAIIVGMVYFILHMISASASKKAHIFAEKFKSEQIAITAMIFLGFILIFLSSFGIYIKLYLIAILSYIAFYIVQNLWRPILVAQYDNYAESSEQATILSIESQTKTIGITIFAPIAGYLADNYGIESSLLMLSFIILMVGFYSLKRKVKV